jgi:hypothetical protein
MNFRQPLTATCLFSILCANAGLAQIKRLTLRSDFPAKTVIVSNMNQELGKKSPVLVAAAVEENGSQRVYRSLLQFNYEYLPSLVMTDPHMILTAELVLYPTNADFLANKYDEAGKLVVKRIIENWYDSITAWDNQPMVDSVGVSKLKVKIHRKEPEIRIDVTNMVKDMIVYGNKGFMICQNNKEVTNMLTGLSFASSLNSDTLRRPLLVITYSNGTGPHDLQQMQLQQRQSRPVSAPTYTPIRTGGSGSSNKSE